MIIKSLLSGEVSIISGYLVLLPIPIYTFDTHIVIVKLCPIPIVH